MDKSGKVDAPFRRLQALEKAAALRGSPAVSATGPFVAIVANPSWSDMTPEEIAALPVREIVADDAVMILRVPADHLAAGSHLSVLAAWGDFRTVTLITLIARRVGAGYSAEFCIVATRGEPVIGVLDRATVIEAPAHGHGVPEAVFDAIEAAVPAPPFGCAEIYPGPHRRVGWRHLAEIDGRWVALDENPSAEAAE
jgi:N6-adenosine-specific RNA methylase IME4